MQINGSPLYLETSMTSDNRNGKRTNRVAISLNWTSEFAVEWSWTFPRSRRHIQFFFQFSEELDHLLLLISIHSKLHFLKLPRKIQLHRRSNQIPFERARSHQIHTPRETRIFEYNPENVNPSTHCQGRSTGSYLNHFHFYCGTIQDLPSTKSQVKNGAASLSVKSWDQSTRPVVLAPIPVHLYCP